MQQYKSELELVTPPPQFLQLPFWQKDSSKQEKLYKVVERSAMVYDLEIVVQGKKWEKELAELNVISVTKHVNR